MSGLATGAGLIDRLFGPGVTGVLSRLDGPEPEPLHAEEASLVADAVTRRRHEFLVGRACAHAALAAMGRNDAAIGVGTRREPLWPSDIVGSIAHGGDWAGAAVADATHALGLGLDIEPLGPPMPTGVEDLVLTATEHERLPGDESEARHWAKVAFTAKECVYKALYPSTGWFLEYADVIIDLDLAEGRWRATLDERFPWHASDLSGRFEVSEGHLFTGLLTVGGGRGPGGGR